ncbi:Decaprenyl diphosphate synthase-like [Dillenia turbinata]|uniref:Alkyl transferase n=1 Tax=Dillenia turbinata TaxID=194707 RepID=A0AAN8VPT7_9MAGN
MFYILSVGPIPSHIAFVMDGNRRYAKKQKLVAGAGHGGGLFALMSMLKNCYELGVGLVTVYAFSIDNFKRWPQEVQSVMELMLEKIEGMELRVYFIGNLKLLSEPIRLAAERAMEATANNSKVVLSIRMAYTSTNEILIAAQKSCKEEWEEVRGSRTSGFGCSLIGLEDTELCPNEQIDLVDLEKHMYMSVAPDPHIIIHTSGETRLSNFLLWQSSHMQLYSPSELWPEIGFWHLVWSVLNFQQNYFYLNRIRKQI